MCRVRAPEPAPTFFATAIHEAFDLGMAAPDPRVTADGAPQLT